MWAYNVARLLAQKAGLRVTPNRALKRDEEMLAAADAYLRMNPIDVFCIIKVHMPLYEKPNLKVIHIERDLRDRIFSIHRFENRPLNEETALLEVTASLDMAAHYEQWPSSHILRVQFDALESDSINLIARIADFMGLPAIGAEHIHEIDAKLAKAQLRKRISNVDRIVFEDIGGLDEHSVSTVKGTSGKIRAYDEETGFQSGHVSDYCSGDWQHLWSDKEKQVIDNAIRIALNERQ